MIRRVFGLALTAAALCSASARAFEPTSTVEALIGQSTPACAAEISSLSGEYLLRLRLRSEVRSVTFLFRAETPGFPGENTRVAFELSQELPPSDRRMPPLVQGSVSQVPEAPPAPGELDSPLRSTRVFRQTIKLPLRENELVWLLRLHSLPAKEGAAALPFRVEMQLDADARPLSDHEKELMAWRERIDPATQPDAVRAKVAELTDEEVHYYTGFKDKAAFLKHWQRTSLDDLRLVKNGKRILRLNEETVGLISIGNPLPNGKYLHHNGKPLALFE